MKSKQITENFSVAEQIQPDDVNAIAEAGFRTVICNRPDGEEPGQPRAAEIEAACEQHGLSFHHMPFAGADVDPALIEAFRSIVDGADGPLFAYCRSGQRSAYLWTLARR